jgi:hypothetical protein
MMQPFNTETVNIYWKYNKLFSLTQENAVNLHSVGGGLLVTNKRDDPLSPAQTSARSTTNSTVNNGI